MKKNNKNFKLGYYALTYIDILNQKSILDKMNKLPVTDEEMKKYKLLLQKSIGVIDAFRKSFEIFHTSRLKSRQKKDLPGLTDEQKKAMEKFQNSDIKHQYFSDTVIYYTGLSKDLSTIPISDIYTLMIMTSFVFLVTLAGGVVSRGCIEAGIGTNALENEIYGPVIRFGYQLEKKVAEYPRIVIGGILFNIIKNEMKIEDNSPEGTIRKLHAQKCFNLVKRDMDGVMILDYLGKEIKDTKIKIEDIIKDAHRFIITSLKNHYSNNNYKLVKRYLLLQNYFETCISKYWVSKENND